MKLRIANKTFFQPCWNVDLLYLEKIQATRQASNRYHPSRPRQDPADDHMKAPIRRCSAHGRLGIPCTAVAEFVVKEASGIEAYACSDIAHQDNTVKVTPWQEWFETNILKKPATTT